LAIGEEAGAQGATDMTLTKLSKSRRQAATVKAPTVGRPDTRPPLKPRGRSSASRNRSVLEKRIESFATGGNLGGAGSGSEPDDEFSIVLSPLRRKMSRPNPLLLGDGGLSFTSVGGGEGGGSVALQPLSPAPTSPSAPPLSPKPEEVYIATHSYAAKTAEECSFDKGHLLIQLSMLDNGW
jgi:hypothetical protein